FEYDARRGVESSRDDELTLGLPYHSRAVPHGLGSLSVLASIEFLSLFQILDNPVQLVEARGPELAVLLEPCGRFLHLLRADLAGPHATDLLGDDEPSLLQDADVLLHAREG